MTRLVPTLGVALAALLLAAPALAADWSGYDQASNDDFNSGSGLKSSYSDDSWSYGDKDDPLTFEYGVRYWYSQGAQSFKVGPFSMSENDSTHAAEGHFRVDDSSSKFYAKGLLGTSFAINGVGTNDSPTSYAGAPGSRNVTVTDGHVTYGGGDLGYSWLGDSKSASFGPFAGYMFWSDSPNMGRYGGTADSQEDNLDINALRLGFSGKVALGSNFDISGEVAAVPYAKIGGTLGSMGYWANTGVNQELRQTSVSTIDGWGYGAMGELLVGFHPTDNLVFRVGGRAWYLQGHADSTFDATTYDVTDPANPVAGASGHYIVSNNPWSLFRYGALAEMTYSF